MRSAISRPAPAPVRCAASLRGPRARASRAAARGRGVAVPALRALCGGGTEPVETRKDGEGLGKEEEAAEELEVLEAEAMGGGDEGRRPTDYDRRAHIFEESSRVFSALKHRHDNGAVGAAAEMERHADSGSS
ncbi:uncharacterized protein LOC121054001 [Oryza brachyantha]|nr:uncharacterized protein LOC121054001 [Oryza brachyantha]